MATSKEHVNDHRLVAESVADGGYSKPDARDRLLVHVAREHGFRVDDVANYGLAPLIHMHDQAHGHIVFASAEAELPEDGLREGLAFFRERADT